LGDFPADTKTRPLRDPASAGNAMVGVRFLTLSTESVVVRYFHTDHLGSISVITDQTGAVSERLSYDAWGKRRYPNGADDPADAITSQTTRGFTNQEELSIGGLVHLNGRVYDTLLGRMMSADPTVPDPLNPQAWNRYSYVGNDPLTFTDPTGFSWLSSFFSSIGNFFKSIFSSSILRSILQIAITAILSAIPGLGPIGLALAAAAGSAIVTGLAGGKLGDILKAAVIAGATAFAFSEIGDLTNGHMMTFSNPNFLPNVAAHAAVGCLAAVASGGKCGPGALSAGISAAAAPLVNEEFPNARTDLAQRLEGGFVSGAIGGLASVAGGGKFADGAVTAAFGYLFNDVMLACRDVALGSAHCGLFVLSNNGGPGTTTQFSLGLGDTTFNQSQTTMDADYAVYKSGNVTIVPPPNGTSQAAFDQSVTDYANSYRAPFYDLSGVVGPNSNSAAAFPIIKAGGAIPDVGTPAPGLGYWKIHTYTGPLPAKNN
jgi:RHS repeat-associated protein